jgi:hypothetical protein
MIFVYQMVYINWNFEFRFCIYGVIVVLIGIVVDCCFAILSWFGTVMVGFINIALELNL